MRNSLLLALALAVLPPSPARAAPATEAADTKKAKEYFAAAQKLYKQGRFAEAIEKFELAYQAKPHPLIYFNIGRCNEELGKVGPALKAYKAYLRLSPEAKDRNQVADTIANLERKLRDQGLQQLTVVVEPPEAKIQVDGQAAGASPATVELAVGSHRVVLSLEGYERIERTISMTPGQASELNFSLVKTSELKTPVSDTPLAERPKTEPGTGVEPAKGSNELTSTEAPKAGAPRKRVWTYVVGGFAVASLGASIGMGIGSLKEAATYQSGATILGVPGQPWPISGPLHEEGMAHYNNTAILSTGANIGYGVAGAAAITAVILFFVEK